jgi:hypothetical protein
MYNLQFADAHRTIREHRSLHPDGPLGPASQAAAYLFSEFDRLRILQSEFFVHDRRLTDGRKPAPDPAVRRDFFRELAAARELAARDAGSPHSQFALILADGMESDYLALVERRFTAALGKARSGRAMAERLLSTHPGYYDAWVAIGVENYLLSLKPAPVRWLLRLAGARTDRAVGIEKLRIAAEKGRYLAPFARLLLAVAALRENDRARARGILAGLAAEFPKNGLVRRELERLDGSPHSGAGK